MDNNLPSLGSAGISDEEMIKSNAAPGANSGESLLAVGVSEKNKSENVGEKVEKRVAKSTSTPQERSVEDKIIAVLSAMLGQDLEDLGLVLRLVADLLGANRVRLWRFDEQMSRLDLVKEHVNEGIEKLAEDWKTLDSDHFPWLLAQMNSSQIVEIDDLDEMVAEAEKEQDMLQRQNVANSMFIPFPIGYTIGGVIQADNLEDMKQWTNLKLMERLSLVARGLGMMFVAAEEKEKVERVKEESAAKPVSQNQVNDYKMVFDSVDMGILVVAPEGTIKEVNPYAASLFNANAEELVGLEVKKLAKMMSSESVEALHRNLGMLHMGTPLPPFEIEVSVDDGKMKVYEVSALVLGDKESSNGDVIVIRDATIKKQIERAVEESERQLRTVLESVKQGIMFSDEEGRFLIFNSEMEQITGYTKEEANSAENFHDLIHPPDTKDGRPPENLSKLNVGEKRSGEEIIVTKNGLKKNVIVSTTVLSHEGKKMFLSAFHDVTDRKRAEDELKSRNVELEQITGQLNEAMLELQKARDGLEDKVREKTEELRKTLVQVEDLAKFSSEDPFPVLRVSPGGQLRYANDASQVLLDAWKTRMGNMLPESWRVLVAEVFETNNRKIAEVELENGIISFVMVPVRSGGYVNMYGRDVTREKEVERMKNEFISMVSHQVRTPLTSMRWYSEMLMKAKDSLSSDQLEIAGTIHETAIQLAELVNDLLNISRMESGRLEYNPEKGDLMATINGVIKELQMQAEKKSVKVTVAADSLSEFMFDPKLVHEVVANLISNAIKYSKDKSEVKVGVFKLDNMVQVDVTDNGLGIPKEAQKDIFKRFYRAQNAVDADIEGTGLGLSVAKLMVEKFGGKMWFTSEPGVKTVFSFTLPLQVVAESDDDADN